MVRRSRLPPPSQARKLEPPTTPSAVLFPSQLIPSIPSSSSTSSITITPSYPPTLRPSISYSPSQNPTASAPLTQSTKLPPTPLTQYPTPTKPPFVLSPEISLGNTQKKQMIFTFDAGAGTQSLQQILDTLQKHTVKGTFFITGSWAVKNPELLKKIADGEHEIFNHTYTHPYLTEASDMKIITELSSTETSIFTLVKRTTKPYFRAPYGDRNQQVIGIAGGQGYRSVYWSIDALDWKEPEGYTAEQVKQRIYNNQKNGAIVLMHIGDNITGQILDEVFTKLKHDGFQIVSLTQGL